MNYNIFLILKKDTQKLLFLLLTLRRYYMKNSYQSALNKINESITSNNNTLVMIDKELSELKAVNRGPCYS